MASVSALPLRSGSSWSSSGATVYGARHTALEGQGQSASLDANVDALRVKPIVAGGPRNAEATVFSVVLGLEPTITGQVPEGYCA